MRYILLMQFEDEHGEMWTDFIVCGSIEDARINRDSRLKYMMSSVIFKADVVEVG